MNLRMFACGGMHCRFHSIREHAGAKYSMHRQFFDTLRYQLGYRDMDDWYNVTLEDIQKYGGARLMARHYNDSPLKALQAVYPEHTWIIWRFGRTPRGFWEKAEQRKQYFDWLGAHLGYKMDDWYN